MITNIQSSILKTERTGREKERISDLLDAEIERSFVLKVAKMKKDGEGLERKAGSGGQNLKRTPEFLERLKKIKEDPTKSLNRLLNDFSVDLMSINRVVREHLGLTSYTRTLRHLLTEDMKRKRLTRCKKVLTWLKGNCSIVKIFSDKKIFTVDQVYNRKNDRWLGETTEGVQGVYRTKHPAQTMVLGVMASNGKKIPPFFFKAGRRLARRPTTRPITPRESMCGRRMGLHHTRRTCTRRHVALLLAVSEPVGLRRVGRIVEEDQQDSSSIRTEWDNMSEEFLINSCKAFRRRVEGVIEAEGGHIE
ncbi:Uncharacterized protein FKW44_003002 [Caligus rogercresseyi]|uniref:Transposase n=1 Tax=Caligus rogercresseyi TaxID=217165 RepID=A0A7T8KL79_CALRO|nr:Uncharacterized protein FKW44_003002 [Caligus rogercresseyi]